MSHVAVAADKRFRRAHVKPARPRRSLASWRRPLRWGLAAVVLLYGAYQGARIVARAHVLQIDRILVRGNERMSSGEVLAVLNGLRGQSLLWADLNVWRRRLLSSPWVRDAHLRRSLPSTVEVAVVERQPSGIGRIRNQLYLVDEGGVIIDEYGPQYAEFDLPVIDGLPEPGAAGSTDGTRMELAARLITSLRPRPELAKRVSQIDVSNAHDATVILSGDAAVIHVGDQQFLKRLQSYVELAPTLHERIPDIDYVDLRFDPRVYVRPVERAAGAVKNGAGTKARAKRKR